MVEKLQIMKGKEIRQDELGPVLIISKILIVPCILAALFWFAQSINLAPFLAFLIFAGLGYYDWRSEK